ncbi:MAG: UDP-N-acetylmuramate dehydrogenase [Bacteroidetes bacterium]|nr:UDP-N-acetylmuramate dehydrogenase [Bacteroidota bacterium]
MLKFTENEALATRHTFAISTFSRYYVETDDTVALFDFLNDNKAISASVLIIGEGSNLLFRNDYPGLILHPVNKGIRIFDSEKDSVIVQAEAGVNWDELVDWSVRHAYGGLENLSMIPGSVGAAPVQNIGAYGTEVGNWITEVLTFNLVTGESKWISNESCAFAYRDSIFKSDEYNNIIVWSVRFKLQKKAQVNVRYKGLNEALKNIHNPGIREIREAVIKIRSSKLPDTMIIGNAGSFFRNPTVTYKKAASIKTDYPDVPTYSTENPDRIKLAAGWLIEKCGYKAYRKADAGVYPNQALVLVNYGSASGDEIYELARDIIESVKSKFNITLEPEVRIL